MRGPKPPTLTLSTVERQELDLLARRHTTPQQLALRARLVMRAAEGLNNAQVARLHSVTVDTVRHWRSRWLGLQAASLDDLSIEERLTDAPRSGKPVRITAEQVCQIIELACTAPAESGRPISQWTAREVALEIKQRGIVVQISDRHAARVLKRGLSSRIAGATG